MVYFVIGKAIDEREAIKILNANGFYKARQNGSHVTYKNNDGRIITITSGKPLSQKTWKRECKKNNIKENI